MRVFLRVFVCHSKSLFGKILIFRPLLFFQVSAFKTLEAVVVNNLFLQKLPFCETKTGISKNENFLLKTSPKGKREKP